MSSMVAYRLRGKETIRYGTEAEVESIQAKCGARSIIILGSAPSNPVEAQPARVVEKEEPSNSGTDDNRDETKPWWQK